MTMSRYHGKRGCNETDKCERQRYTRVPAEHDLEGRHRRARTCRRALRACNVPDGEAQHAVKRDSTHNVIKSTQSGSRLRGL
jgi:hypothetical protein